ncbi:thioredoxin fold domain-containing protein [Mucilaginibacter sp. RS28]|uniref:Thioredoxin fold domain-containing protein n=1 Tax=Mucilaginibacter straminoryzae TaxID=2932774 RepID=A0A9X1X151_9SPHI|nr:thioredoxin fold domain-containing protein [Mucilaginibacter straminoryzae]MCJ8208475.1 thioredoxin fold domain-containing protein [Mucilaginibacter straminoryzae]
MNFRNSATKRKAFAVIWLIGILSCIGGLFWYNEWQYTLPTPVPAGYKAVNKGVKISLDKNEIHLKQKSKPLFLHFFNPDCPCSRFNIKAFKELASRYGTQVDFAVVVISKKKFTQQQIQQQFSLQIPVLFDTRLARRCGVYSTPQAVLLGRDSRLFYRGNYNSSRYCTQERTNYARQAIDGLLDQKEVSFDELALRSYGCSLAASAN